MSCHQTEMLVTDRRAKHKNHLLHLIEKCLAAACRMKGFNVIRLRWGIDFWIDFSFILFSFFFSFLFKATRKNDYYDPSLFRIFYNFLTNLDLLSLLKMKTEKTTLHWIFHLSLFSFSSLGKEMWQKWWIYLCTWKIAKLWIIPSAHVKLKKLHFETSFCFSYNSLWIRKHCELHRFSKRENKYVVVVFTVKLIALSFCVRMEFLPFSTFVWSKKD